MNVLEAVAKWYGCPYGLKRCRKNCENYLYVDPRLEEKKGVGPGPKDQRTLCSLLDDLNNQIMGKTSDTRLIEEQDSTYKLLTNFSVHILFQIQ